MSHAPGPVGTLGRSLRVQATRSSHQQNGNGSLHAPQNQEGFLRTQFRVWRGKAGTRGEGAPPLPTTWRARFARSEASGRSPSSGCGGGGAEAGAVLRGGESQYLPRHRRCGGARPGFPGQPRPGGERGQPGAGHGGVASGLFFFFFFVRLDKERFPCAFKR